MVEGGRTAVVVDDDADVRLILRVALGASGFVVHEAGTGQEGVALARERHPDLITLDLVLPGISGSEACRRIREFSDAYVIMITSSSDEADRLVGLAIGADDYVTKPFSPREVQARVEAMFRRPRAGNPEATIDPDVPLQRRPRPSPAAGIEPEPGILRHGGLSLDVDGRVAWLAGTELSLTRTEFDLLATMAGNPRRVWRRETLLTEVWGGQWSEHHVVEVHMGNLRRKLGEAAEGGATLIRTVRGVGYRLAPLAPRSGSSYGTESGPAAAAGQQSGQRTRLPG